MDEWVGLQKCVRCMQWLCCGFGFGGMDSCRDVPQYKVMNYLVFGIISVSLLSELQVLIPEVDHNAVVDAVMASIYPTLCPGGTAECVYRPPLSIVPSVLMSTACLLGFCVSWTSASWLLWLQVLVYRLLDVASVPEWSLVLFSELRYHFLLVYSS
jgi:hypothetical protein